MLVWLTRILFIGAFSVAGEDMFDLARGRAEEDRAKATARPQPQAAAPLPAKAASTRPLATAPKAVAPAASPRPAAPRPKPAAPTRPAVTYEPVDDPFDDVPAPKTNGANGPSRPTSRIQQRPPMPGSVGRTPTTGNLHARSSNGGH
jgi:translation initiation factor IF-2